MRRIIWLALLPLLAWSSDAGAQKENGAPPAPGLTRTEPRSGLEFVSIPAGTFHSGCEPQDAQCDSSEKLDGPASVGAFWLGRTPVTVAAYGKCVAAGACTEPPSGGSCNWKVNGKENHPVNCVDWNQATAFCQWIGGRLPTAQEWEYAAKGGESRIYPWGNESPSGIRALYDGAYDRGTAAADWGTPGATKQGLLNMAGNVWQWTASNYDTRTKELRGGSWFNGATFLRASSRGAAVPSDAFISFGVRCAL